MANFFFSLYYSTGHATISFREIDENFFKVGTIKCHIIKKFIRYLLDSFNQLQN